MIQSFQPATPSAISRLWGVAVVALLACAGLPESRGIMVTEPVGYIRTELSGGTPASPGTTFVSPSLVNPVQWQGEVTGFNGERISVSPADWEAGHFDARFMLEIVSGANAGLWAPVLSASGNELTAADALASMLSVGDTVRIRRFTTLSDFLGADNEAELQTGASLAGADQVTVYHVGGANNYWYYNGSQGGSAGWYDAAWRPSANAVIAPGEGVVLRRRSVEPFSVHEVGMLRGGAFQVAVNSGRALVGGVAQADIPLADSQLYTGDPMTGFASGASSAGADQIVIYGRTAVNVYWYYNGSQGGAAGWYDASWRPAGNAVIPAGSTFVIDRANRPDFIWALPLGVQ